MKPNFISEDDFKVMENRVRKAGPVGAVAIDSQDKGRGRKVATVTPSPHKFKSNLEQQYAAHLDVLVRAGEIKRWWYEPTSFKLSKGKRFRPDFLIQYPDGLERRVEYVEIKSRWNPNIRDGLTHLKWCAQLYPCFTWRIVYWKGGGWDGQYVDV